MLKSTIYYLVIGNTQKTHDLISAIKSYGI